MIKLVKLSKEYENQYIDMMTEWRNSGEKIVPYSIRRQYNTFEELLERLDNDEKGIDIGDFVPASTYFAYDEEADKLVGAVNIRHCLNERILKESGHIGDGVRPSQRRKGYATEMIKQALEICKNEFGITKVLMTCDKSNIGSAKSIINNGGVLENEIMTDSHGLIQRYWIDI